MEGIVGQMATENNGELKEVNVPLKTMTDCPESSLDKDANATEDKDLARCVISRPCSGPPYASPYSGEDTGTRIAVEELTAGNYRNSEVALASGTSISKEDKSIYLRNLARRSRFMNSDGEDSTMPQGMDQMLLKIRQQLARTPHDRQSLDYFASKRSNQSQAAICAYLRATGGMKISEAAAYANPQQKIFPGGFSQLIRQKASKGKGIVSRNHEILPERCGGNSGGRDEKLTTMPNVASDALWKSSANCNTVNLYGVDTNAQKSFQDGISLRQFIRPGCPNRNKAQSLFLFRQVVELVHRAHSQGFILLDMSPSCFTLSPTNQVIYTGSFDKKESDCTISENMDKRPLEQEVPAEYRDFKLQKLNGDVHSLGQLQYFPSSGISRNRAGDKREFQAVDSQTPSSPKDHYQEYSSCPITNSLLRQPYIPSGLQMEEQCYVCPQMLSGKNCTIKSNIYGLGVLLFELLCRSESTEMHSVAMSNLRHRILPPSFLSENSKEAGFCLWLLHPNPSSRPTTREIMQSELMFEADSAKSDATNDDEDGVESELLLHFLTSLKDQKQTHAAKLLKDIQSLDEDIKEAMRRYSSRLSMPVYQAAEAGPGQSHHKNKTSVSQSSPFFVHNVNEKKFLRNISQLEDAYFFMRSQIRHTNSASAARSDKSLPKNRERMPEIQSENKDRKAGETSGDQLGDFFEGLCKFARYNKFEVCGNLRSGDLLNSANVICSLSFDRDEEHIAATGISKRIKIFDFSALMNNSVDVHYPVMELHNKFKLTCVCWNSYIKNYLASTDYDGVVQMWDACTGQGFSQFKEHQKRAWSVDFSQSDPTKFASGSDECSVKLWSINEKRSIGTIWSPANVCCVQFSTSRDQLLSFGSADYKVYCYDLRYARVPWCTLAGHEKAVSYVKFLDSETIVSASTDSSLKLWDLKKTCSTGLSSDACTLTFKGHTNQKNFIGLSVFDGHIACGSETNEVFCYYRSLPMPIASYKFDLVDPMSGHELDDSNGQFVSSVCWRRKSNMLVAANSIGSMKLLKLV